MSIMDENGNDADFPRDTPLFDPGRPGPLWPETPEEEKDRKIEELEQRIKDLEREERKRKWDDIFRIFPRF